MGVRAGSRTYGHGGMLQDNGQPEDILAFILNMSRLLRTYIGDTLVGHALDGYGNVGEPEVDQRASRNGHITVASATQIHSAECGCNEAVSLTRPPKVGRIRAEVLVVTAGEY